jgi:hypothetical protein
MLRNAAVWWARAHYEWVTNPYRGQEPLQRVAHSVRASDHQMPQATTTPTRTRRNTYTGYSIGCAAVWGVILVAAQRRLDAQARNTLWLVCSGWWMGWTSATIARVSFPPPKKLGPRTEERLGIVSIVLIAVGLISVIRLLIAGKKRPANNPADPSGGQGINGAGSTEA